MAPESVIFSTSPTSASTGRTCGRPAGAAGPLDRTAAAHPGAAGRARPPLRRWPRDPRRRSAGVRPRAPRAGGDVVNELVGLSTDGSAEPRVIASGHDFYAAPRLSLDGRRLAWLIWDHPRMPWDGTELWAAELAGDGALSAERLVAGGPQESILQPLWSLPAISVSPATAPAGGTCMRSRWARAPASSRAPAERPACPNRARLSPATRSSCKAPWVFGLQHYVFLADGTLAVSYTEDGRDHLAVLDPPAGEQGALLHEGSALRELESPYSASIHSPRSATGSL